MTRCEDMKPTGYRQYGTTSIRCCLLVGHRGNHVTRVLDKVVKWPRGRNVTTHHGPGITTTEFLTQNEIDDRMAVKWAEDAWAAAGRMAREPLLMTDEYGIEHIEEDE